MALNQPFLIIAIAWKGIPPEWVDKIRESEQHFLELFPELKPYVAYIPREPEMLVGLGIALCLFIILLLMLALRTRRKPVPTAVLTRKVIRRAARRARELAEVGDYLAAGDQYNAVGLFEEARKMYQKAQASTKLAYIYLKENKIPEAAENFEKGWDFENAAELYRQAGDYEAAAKNYLKIGNERAAADMFEKAKDWIRAANAYREAGFFRKAAELYQKSGDKIKLAQCLEDDFQHTAAREKVALSSQENTSADETESGGGKVLSRNLRNLALWGGKAWMEAGKPEPAANLFEQGGHLAEAAITCRDSGNLSRATDLFFQAGMEIEAADILEQMGDEKRSALLKARAYQARGDLAAAGNFYKRAGDLASAAHICKKLGNQEEAAGLYEKGGFFLEAAAVYKEIGQQEKAAENFERAEKLREAAEIYHEVGNLKKESELFEGLSEFYEAGVAYRKRGMGEKAIQLLQKVERSSPHYQAACQALGDLFREKGLLKLALQKYQEAIGDEEIKTENLDAYYNFGVIFEQIGEAKTALAIYEKILSFEYHYRDVSARAGNLREVVARMTPSAPESPFGGQSTLAGQEDRLSTATQTATGKQSKRYEVIEELGRGGMGVVYKARDTLLDRVIALKVLPHGLRDSETAIKNFLREAKAAAALNHPNIVTIYDAGQEGGVFYIVMEYIQGQTVKEILLQSRLIPLPALVLISGQVCRGLAYAHENKIVHLDIKTSNVMWTEKKIAKIMDFGLAKALRDARNLQTVVGGTPFYMSPEQTLGEEVDQRSDIYSLGVMLFEMATGLLPFREGDVGYHHVHTPVPNPSQFNPRIPTILENVVLKCLEKEPDNRFQSTLEIFEELKKIRV
ncbi:MAG: protein kinase [Proteobacteria bacterium]|nr:protein kinase [Pseudomonadota bacterium]